MEVKMKVNFYYSVMLSEVWTAIDALIDIDVPLEEIIKYILREYEDIAEGGRNLTERDCGLTEEYITEKYNLFSSQKVSVDETDMGDADKASEVCAKIEVCADFDISLEDTVEYILKRYYGFTEEYIIEKYNWYSRNHTGYGFKTEQVGVIVKAYVYFGKSLKEIIDYIQSKYDDDITEKYITEEYNSYSSEKILQNSIR
jgi:hypothetical protein